jgi:twitching motility protein PilU
MDRQQAAKFMLDCLRTMLQRKGSDLFISADFPAGLQDRRQADAADGDAAEAGADLDADPLHHERPSDPGVRRHQGVQLRDRAARHRALPRQCLRPAGTHRRVLRIIPTKIPKIEELGCRRS